MMTLELTDNEVGCLLDLVQSAIRSERGRAAYYRAHGKDVSNHPEMDIAIAECRKERLQALEQKLCDGE